MKRVLALILFSIILLTACKQQPEPITDKIVIENQEVTTETVDTVSNNSEISEVVETEDTETVESQPDMQLNETTEATATDVTHVEDESQTTSTSDERAQNNPNIEQIAEDIAREIYGSNGGGQVHQVPQEVLDALGATPSQGVPTGPSKFGTSELPDSLKGGRLE